MSALNETYKSVTQITQKLAEQFDVKQFQEFCGVRHKGPRASARKTKIDTSQHTQRGAEDMLTSTNPAEASVRLWCRANEAK